MKKTSKPVLLKINQMYERKDIKWKRNYILLEFDCLHLQTKEMALLSFFEQVHALILRKQILFYKACTEFFIKIIKIVQNCCGGD